MKIFVTGIGTGVGKTVVSALLAKKYQASYWKPIQCGSLQETDASIVEQLTRARIVPTEYSFHTSKSPAEASKIEGVNIDVDRIVAKGAALEDVVIEGAGGLLTPISEESSMADLCRRLDIPAIIVSQHYLGSINHTLMTCKVLKSMECKIGGLVFVGDRDQEKEELIIAASGVRCIGRVPWMNRLTLDSQALSLISEGPF